MPTPRQILNGARKPKKVTKTLNNSPQKKAIINKVYTMNPVKPNSARRAVARVRLSDGSERTIFIPGEKVNLKEFDEIFVNGGGAQDLPGVRSEMILGARIGGVKTSFVKDRKNSRSRYGTPKPKK